jgi:hypothetical protein
MTRERAFSLFLVVALLAGGWLMARAFGGGEALVAEPAEADFREWLWSRRALDLMVQIGLILAGALGVAAILPDEREENDDSCAPR